MALSTTKTAAHAATKSLAGRINEALQDGCGEARGTLML
jgi:hypothetical protein